MFTQPLAAEHPFALIADDLFNHGLSVRDHTVAPQLMARLARCAKEVGKDGFHRAGIGPQHRVEVETAIRSDQIHWLEPNHLIESQWLAYMSELQCYLNRTLYLGLFSYESHFAHYAPGTFYKKHWDAFAADASRMLSTVLYLNRHWSAGDGGELILYEPSDAATEVRKITPEFGRLCVFLSREFPHEVLPAARDRWSIAGWFRVNGSHHGKVDPPG